VIEDEGSVVAITLSWPSEPGTSADERVAGQGRGLHIIELIGDIDVRLAGQTREILTSLAARGADLTVDVSQVRFIDDAGLGVLAAMHGRATESGGQFSLIGAAPSVRRSLHITQLTHLLAGDPSCR
jgi:anti-anti-sigma factor